MDPSTKQNPYMLCVLRGSSEILIARPAIEIQPDGEDRRFILQTESDQYPNVRRTVQIGWIVSTTDGTVLDAISDFDFHEIPGAGFPSRIQRPRVLRLCSKWRESARAHGYFAGSAIQDSRASRGAHSYSCKVASENMRTGMIFSFRMASTIPRFSF